MTIKDVDDKVEANTDAITNLLAKLHSLNSRFDLLLKKLDPYHKVEASSDKTGDSNIVLPTDLANKESSAGFSSSVNQKDTKIAPSVDDEQPSTKSVVVDSIPSAVIEVSNFSDVELITSDVNEIDDFLEVDFIPPFFFVEEDDVDPLDDMSLQLENDECLNEFFFLHSKFLGMTCFQFELHDSRLLFDRGKCADKLVLRLLLNFGYKSIFSSMQSIHLLCANNTAVYDETQLFVKMPDRNDIFTLVLAWMVKHGEIHELLVNMPDIVVCKWSSGKSLKKVFDRGNEFQPIQWLSSFVCASGDYFGPTTSGVRVIIGSVLLELLVVIVDRQSDVLLMPLEEFKYLILLTVLHVQQLWLLVIFSRWECIIFSGNSSGVNWIDLCCLSFHCWHTNWFYPQLAETLTRNQSLVFLQDDTTCAGSQASDGVTEHKVKPQILLLEVTQDFVGLPTAEFSQPPTYCRRNQMIVFNRFGSHQYFLLWYSYEWGLVYHAREDSTSIAYSVKGLRTQVLPMVLQLVNVTVDRQGAQLHLFVQEFKLVAVLISSVHSSVTAQFYLSRIRFALVYMNKDQKLLFVIPILNVLLRIEFLRWKYKFFSTGWWSNLFCEAGNCNQIAAHCVVRHNCKLVRCLEQFEIIFFHILVRCVVSRQNFGDILPQLHLSLPTATRVLYGELLKNTEILQFVSRLSTEIFLSVHQILHWRLLLEYLRWKFNLVPTDLWSLQNASWTSIGFISVVYFDANENCRRNLFYNAEIHHQLASVFMNLSCWNLAAANGPARMVFCKAAKALEILVNILFWIITKYVTISQFLTQELFDKAHSMTHRELCKDTNLESSEYLYTSADMFASLLEQPTSQLAGSNDAKAPIYPGKFNTSMAAQILLMVYSNSDVFVLFPCAVFNMSVFAALNCGIWGINK